MNNEIQNKIDAYLRGEMTVEDIRKFEFEVENDPSLSEQLELTRQLQQVLTKRQAKLEKMAQWDREIHQSSVSKQPSNRWRWLYVGMVAVACLLGVFVLFPTDRKVDYVYDADFFQREIPYRGANSGSDIDQLIVSGNFVEALSAIDSLERLCQLDLETIVKDGNDEEAEYHRLVIAETLYQLTWERIHLCLAQNEVDQAVSLLQQFRMQNGEFQTKAEQLWVKLKEQ